MNYIKGNFGRTRVRSKPLGWLAVALVIFATWKSLRAIWVRICSAFLYWAYNYIPGLSRSTLELFKMPRYVVTILVLLMVSMRKKKEDQPPQSLWHPVLPRRTVTVNSLRSALESEAVFETAS